MDLSSLARAGIRVALVFSGLTFLAWIPANLAMPLARDQGIFAFAGQAILDGGLPYVDAWEHKGPATHFLYAAAMGLFGSTAFGVRLFDIALTIAMATGAWAFGRARGRPWWGLLTGLFVWVAFGGGFWHTAQVEGWLAYALLLAMFALWLEPTRHAPIAMVAVGVVLATGVLIKPNFALMAPIVLVGCATRWRALGWVAIGAAATLGAALALFGAAGALAALWDAVVVFNLGSHISRGSWTATRVFNLMFEPFGWPDENAPALWMLQLMAVIGAASMWRSDRRGFWILVTGAVCGWVTGVSQVKGFFYHSMVLYAVVAAFAAEAVTTLIQADGTTDRSIRWRQGVVALAMAALVLATQPLYFAAHWLQYRAGLQTKTAYERSFCEDYDDLGFCHRDLAAAAAFLRERTRADERVYMWGMDALMHLEAGRRSPTRFGFNYAIVGGAPAYATPKKAEVMAALTARPPAAIVVQELDRSNITPLTAREQLAHFPELQALIERDYRPAFANANFTVYLRR